MRLKDLWEVLRDAGDAWIDDRCPRIGAALAFYTALSLSPMLVIALAVTGMVYGEEAARGELADQIRGVLGAKLAETVEGVLANSKAPGTSVPALALGLVMLFVGATGVFGELQEGINDVWKVRPKRGRPVWTFLRSRFLSFGMVLGVGFLLLVSMALSTAVEAAGRYASGHFPGVAGLIQVMNFALMFLVEGFLFGMIFKVLPDAKLLWRDVLTGAAVTAVLFTLGKYLIVQYLSIGGVGSAFGAAGSVVALLAWIYYSTQILLFGAEVTKVVAEKAHRRIAPAKGAEAVPGADTPVVAPPKT